MQDHKEGDSAQDLNLLATPLRDRSWHRPVAVHGCSVSVARAVGPWQQNYQQLDSHDLNINPCSFSFVYCGYVL
ncbi:hypothetical protein E2C01_053463 [Portunus trituberculatus]|uniref:Uncharacterized protein n=1 Tax=Portunus trituberculatus TaxID=210409 RepID=A0A5B7GS54_PORTR|nr:hypothetical protein [Portunus trituberculatus]